jgi:lipopolysaccharide export system permease protein
LPKRVAVLNKLALLLLRTFIGPFLVTFLIALFILDMQFLWVYVDELMGKGLENSVILELMIYASARLVNMALPLALLMSSIMTMGALAEHYELTAMKSAGLSLGRILRPLTFAIIGISIGAFYFSNNVWPIANLKFRTLLYSVSQQRPALNLQEGVFYNGIEGFSIRVSHKNQDTGLLSDVLIYDHRDQSQGSKMVIRAKKGKMWQTDDKRYLILTLYEGSSYDEQKEETTKRADRTYPHVSSTFHEQEMRIDLSSLDFNKADEDLFKRAYEMMTIKQLETAVDSIDARIAKKKVDLVEYGKRNILILKDSINLDTVPLPRASKSDFLANLASTQQKRAIEVAKEITRNASRNIENTVQDMEGKRNLIDKHDIEWHRKFFLSFSCLVLFFIGAPLGAIIRKGGMGLPTVWAIVLFLLYYVLSILGERMVKSGTLEPMVGMWISSVVLFPLSIFLTYKAATDSSIMQMDTYVAWFRKVFKRKPKEETIT